MTVRRFTIEDASFELAPDQEGDVYLGNVIERADGSPFTVGFGRYAPHQSNSETLAFDETMTIIRGRLTVRSVGGDVHASAGDVVFMPRGTAVEYLTDEDGAELTYVTYPHWKDTVS